MVVEWFASGVVEKCFDLPSLLDLSSFHRNGGRRTGVGSLKYILIVRHVCGLRARLGHDTPVTTEKCALTLSPHDLFPQTYATLP
eukprot:scaffold15611_cov55-Attheya_sp.AAC.3